MRFIIPIVFAITVCACDLFTTREAEVPDQPRSQFQTPTSAEILIDNLVNSLKDKNVENYLSCFADSNYTSRIFHFTPSSGAFTQFPALLTAWSKKDEEQYFNNLKVRIKSELPMTLQLSNITTNPFGDSVIYSASYILIVPHDAADLPTDFSGELRFTFVRDSRALWSIAYWQDIRVGNLSSWSDLKERFY